MDALIDRAGLTAPWLPEVAPLAMPVQSLRVAPPRGSRPPTAPRDVALRRLLVIGGAVALTAAGADEM